MNKYIVLNSHEKVGIAKEIKEIIDEVDGNETWILQSGITSNNVSIQSDIMLKINYDGTFVFRKEWYVDSDRFFDSFKNGTVDDVADLYIEICDDDGQNRLLFGDDENVDEEEIDDNQRLWDEVDASYENDEDGTLLEQ